MFSGGIEKQHRAVMSYIFLILEGNFADDSCDFKVLLAVPVVCIFY